MCCPDGYIYDCYTGFPANWNDSDIMLYILETDNELLRICEPEKTVFVLDRGKISISIQFSHSSGNFVFLPETSSLSLCECLEKALTERSVV